MTREQRASALGSVMVTNTGEIFASEMNLEDLAIFEYTINDLNKIAPNFLNEQSDSHYAHLYDTRIEKIIGFNGYTKIINNTISSYRYVDRIAVECAGTLIGPKHILAAGYCVASGRGNWYSSLNFSVGQNDSSRPYRTTS